MMKKLSLLFALALTGCAGSTTTWFPPAGPGYLLNGVSITSNYPNLCDASGMQYAFKTQLSWISGGAPITWMGCVAQRQLNLQPAYLLDYSIIKNDGSGEFVAHCTPVYPAGSYNQHFTQVNVMVKMIQNEFHAKPACKVIFS